MSTSSRTLSFIKRAWLPALALALLVLGCRSGSKHLTMFVSADSRGYLEPCGCRRDQAGGLPGRKRLVDKAAKDARVVFDVGSMTNGSRDYDLLKLSYMLKGMEAIGYDAVNLGKEEAQLDLDTLKGVMEKSSLPFVSANVMVKKTGERLTEPYRIVEKQGIRIGVIGVTSCDSEDVGPGITVKPPVEAVSEFVAEVKPKCDYLVVLAFCDDDTIKDIAGKFHEVDCILGGDVPQPSGAVQIVNRSSIFNVTDHGKVVGQLELAPEGDGYGIKTSKGVKIAADKVAAPKEIAQLLDSYKNELRERRYELASVEGMDRIEATEGTANEFVGGDKCISCHQEAHKTWLASTHSHALQTLISVKSEYDPDCLRCHTVGYGLSSGFIDQTKTQNLGNVQCENCHGRGKDHVASQKKTDLKPVTPASCVKCHDEENSENFQFKSFWAKIAH